MCEFSESALKPKNSCRNRRRSLPPGALVTSSTRLQVEITMPSSTPGWRTRVCTASGRRASGMASRSRTSSGALLWFTPMNFKLIGVNHNSAPLEVRERLAIPEARLPEAVQTLVRHPGVEEGMVISTCNRVELVTSAPGGSDLRRFLHEFFGFRADSLNSHIYEFEKQDVVRHVFRVASSLDSMVVGEPQILGQVKEAYAVARGVGAVHSSLDALISRSFAVAKRVRTETAIGGASVSISSVAVQLA